MRFVIIGPGALGCLFAATLGSDPRHEVWLLDHDRQRADLLTWQGILLTDAENRERRSPIRATADAGTIPGCDCILLCVKSHQVPTALDAADPLFRAAPLTITLQNGITHLETIGARLPAQVWAAGVTAQGATLLGPGRVRHGGSGPTRIGFMKQPVSYAAATQLQRIAAALTLAGITTEVAADIRQHVWRKLLINVGINALTAIHDCANGGLLSSPAALLRMRRAVSEGAAVAAGLGITLAEDPVALAMDVCAATASNISSMLQDVRNRRATEIDAINGAVVKAGHRLRLAVPENEALTSEIKALESNFSDDYP
ncbi:MAG: 2-dehydropantoate 2-reductase [Desulfobulbaceae bacterium]|nr:2-dehydropantoate 2-reductase [Desulfobulbaceae bacterium]